MNTPKTQVMVLATQEGRHDRSTDYPYEKLYAMVADFKPDAVGVQIAADDISGDPVSLRRKYLVEMIELASRHRPIAFGFDWAGQYGPIAKLESALELEWELDASATDAAKGERYALEQEASFASVNGGRYERISERWLAALEAMVKGKNYARIPAYYRERARRVAANAADAVARYPGRRMAIAVLPEHRGPIVAQLEKRFGDGIEFVKPV